MAFVKEKKLILRRIRKIFTGYLYLILSIWAFIFLQSRINAQILSDLINQNRNDRDNQLIRSFINEELECNQYVFPPGEFPKFRWKNEIKVEDEVGSFPLSVRYFDKDFKQVSVAVNLGRYGAVIDGITPSGFIIKRYVTLFCANIEFDDYSDKVPIKMNNLAEYGIDNKKWEKYSLNEERFSFGSFKFFPMYNADAAIFLSGLNEIEDLKNNYDTPRIRDRQWWITMKNLLESDRISTNPLKHPLKLNFGKSIVNEIVFNDKGYDKESFENLREVCEQWAEKGEAAHVTMIVHKGKIIFHESFGYDEEGIRVSKDAKMWMASITKLLTGVLMIQFVDQKIIDLDAPVSFYLPELNVSGSDKLTVRHLFTHTSGLQFLGELASDWNYALENQIAHVLPTIELNQSFSYHRVGYALAGKIMERISGKAVPYLFNEYIFSPLGMRNAYSDNTYGGLYCTATDLAKLGQMLLNKGIYNGFKFFSERSFTKMLPQKLPDTDRTWGIGTSPKIGIGLSELAFGHDAASGSVFCIDPKYDLIIISVRNKTGKLHSEFEKKFIEASTALIKTHK